MEPVSNLLINFSVAKVEVYAKGEVCRTKETAYNTKEAVCS